MKKAYLDCIRKTITFNVKDENYVVDLTEGDLEDSTNAIRYGKQTYDTNFTWGEEDGIADGDPCFAIIPVKKVKGGKGEEDYLEADWEESISYDVEILSGDVQDYFGKVFPMGHKSWATTLAVMTQQIDGINNYGMFKANVSGIWGITEELIKFTDEFEREHQYTDWEDESYEDCVVEFLTEKLEKY